MKCTPPRRLAAGLATLAVIAATGLVAPAAAEDAPQSTAKGGWESLAAPLSEAERRAIEGVVRDYILENPEIIREAVQILQQREQQASAERQRSAVKANLERLHDTGPLPVLGNPDGDVTVVEFFDYRCPYCRSVAPDLLRVIEEDGNVRLVLKEFPILGQESLFAARAAVAAARQGAYETFHQRLMTEVNEVTRDSVLALAEDMGLDTAQLQADMNADGVDTYLRGSYGLAEALEIGGTPAFVVGDTLVPGALSAERLRQLIAQARNASG